MDKATIRMRLDSVRQCLNKHQIDAVIVPSADPHMSEYLPECWQARAFFSGFTGSAGTLIVAREFADVWADSRYWIQAENQLAGTNIALKKIQANKAGYAEDLLERLPEGAVVAVDGMVLSVADFERLERLFAKKSITLKLFDVIGEVWQDRPALPNAPIYCHEDNFVSQSSLERLTAVRTKMQDKAADFHLISSLDDIAWLTNLRGQDVPCNPVFLAHMLLGKESAVLYVDGAKLDENLKARLLTAGIVVADYTALMDDLSKIQGTLLIDGAKVAIGVLAKLPSDVHLLQAMNPSTLLKAIKSEQDIAHIRQAMVQDGVALCEFFADLEKRLAAGEVVTEVDVDALLIAARSRQDYYRGPSFDSIVGFGEHGAIVHYRAEAETCKKLQGDGLLLIDSGCQYDNGTTDITRMMGIGTVGDDAKRDVTYVLKAHIALASAVFPVGIASPMLDMIARRPMWAAKLDYGHGTGHGVGYFLNVHEGPQAIAYSAPITPERTMLAGMITSNEPGIYRENQWGVRIENLIATIPAGSSEFGEFLAFENLTLCPIDTRIILPELLTAEEKAWLNAYHDKVQHALAPHLAGEAKVWLMARTEAI